MRSYTRRDVLMAIPRVFPDDDPEQILELLDLYGEDSHEPDDPDRRARVHLGILKSSGGDRDKLLEMIALAKIDYRDLLCHADDFREDGDPYRKLID